MRLLVTNARCSQAYFVLRALRPYAEWITVTMSGPRAIGFWPTCHAAYSRMVDRRCRVPHPERDWHAGIIQPENTNQEQVFVEEILKICERDRIDTIFPTNDPWVYVFAKNKSLFARHGILIPIPDYDTVRKPIDKYETVQCAREVGFPTPKSCLYDEKEELEQLIDDTQGPWLVRPRCTNGSRGLAFAAKRDDVKRLAEQVRRLHGTPMIQEYVPGNRVQNYYIVLDKAGKTISVFTPRILRTCGRIIRNSTGSSISQENAHYSAEAVGLLRHLGWWGGATVQTKIDPRDGQPKLMEVNPRLGQYLWTRTEIGINEPLLCLQIARNESPRPLVPGEDYPLDCLLLEPFSDITNFLSGLIELGIYRFRKHILRRRSMDPESAPDGVGRRLLAYKREYLGSKQRRYHPSFRYLLEDPRPCLLWISKKIESSLRLLVKGIRYH
jgi:biotin carboxylase